MPLHKKWSDFLRLHKKDHYCEKQVKVSLRGWNAQYCDKQAGFHHTPFINLTISIMSKQYIFQYEPFCCMHRPELYLFSLKISRKKCLFYFSKVSKYADEVDHPLSWIKEAAVHDQEHEIQKRAEEYMDREIQKRTFDITKSNRMSRYVT